MKNMNWNWKQEIGIFPDVADSMLEYKKYLTEDEQYVFGRLLIFYEKNISVDTVFNVLVNNTYVTWEQTGMYPVEELKSKIVKIPDILLDDIKQKMLKAICVNPLLENEIRELYACARDTEYGTKTDWQILDLYFEDNLKNIKICGTSPIKLINSNKMDKDKIVEKATNLLYDISVKYKDVFPILIQEKTKKEKYCNFNIDDKSGSSEYWCKEIIGEEADLIVIHTDDNNLGEQELEYELYKYAYPGIKEFYDLARSKCKNIDFGSTLLAKSWGNYCAWNFLNSTYSRSRKINDITILSIMLNTNLNYKNKCQKLYNSLRVQGYSVNRIKDFLFIFTQRPLQLECEILGALVIEKADNVNFLSKVCNNSLGDFYMMLF